MIKKIHIEKISKEKEDKILNTPLISKQEATKAFIHCIEQIEASINVCNDKFLSPNTYNNKYKLIPNIEWTNGFFTGMIFLCYEYTKDEKFLNIALNHIDSFYDRIKNKIEVNHHDLGFLYSPSCVSAVKILDSKKAKDCVILAANQLISRYREKGEFIQAWGTLDAKEHYRFIIDCMLNLPLLYFASNITNDDTYKIIAKKHLNTSIKYCIREDASTFHTFYMDPSTGLPLKGVTRQGFNDNSSWARGQAWGIYGIPLNIENLSKEDAIPLFKGLTNYFINRQPNDFVSIWDLIFTENDNQPKDSSSSAIAVCGMLSMKQFLEKNDQIFYEKCSNLILRSLINNYTTNIEPLSPILKHGVYSYHSNKGVNEGNVWGDYFYMEALSKIITGFNSYF